MYKLNPTDYKITTSIFRMNQKTLTKTLYKYLCQKYDKVIYSDDYLYAPGEIPIALVAHMDTVFKAPPREIYYDEKCGVMWSPDGLGGDDRCGVLAILKIIQSGLRPSVIFTTDEEIGGIGAMKLVDDFPQPINPINYIIELDRRGVQDCVFYDCLNLNFIDYVEKFGFTEAFGSFSDICEICPVWKIAGVNLSIGYEDEHMEIETFHLAPWKNTIDKVKVMLQQSDIPKFVFIKDPSARSFGSFFNTSWEEYADDECIPVYGKYHCVNCGKVCSEYEVFAVEDKNENIVFYCPDCAPSHIDWCNDCGNPYELGLKCKCQKGKKGAKNDNKRTI